MDHKPFKLPDFRIEVVIDRLMIINRIAIPSLQLLLGESSGRWKVTVFEIDVPVGVPAGVDSVIYRSRIDRVFVPS